MKLAIVGTSKSDNILSIQCENILSLHDKNDTTVISGGATGVDIAAENMAKNMGFKTEVFLPKEKNWESFKERNIKIAENCDILYCITTSVKTKKCYHHTPPADHEKTAGCWTMNKAKELGKKTFLFVIH